MFRKRKQPTPSFRMPAPFQPMTGERAPLVAPGLFPYCVLMQVAAEDVHDNYVLCRGFDTRINRFVDYESGNADKPGIPVAKPYGCREAGIYEVAEVYAALLPVQGADPDSNASRVPPSPVTAPIRLGQNPGKAASSSGHPQDLAEELATLFTVDGKVINWMFLECPPTAAPLRKVLATECKEPGANTASTADIYFWSGSAWEEELTGITVYDDEYRVFLLPGEWAWAVKNGDRYDFVGSYGLTRKAAIDSPGIVDQSPGNATVVTHLTESCDGASSGCQVAVCNYLVCKDLSTDEEVTIAFFERMWHVISACPDAVQAASPLRKVLATACKLPGDDTGATADIYSWSGSAWVEEDTGIAVFDDEFHVFLLPGEWAWAVMNGSRYDFIGTYGLSRKGEVDEGSGIADEGEGTVIVFTHEQETPDCDGVASNCTVEACNYIICRDLDDNEEVQIRFYERKWHVVAACPNRTDTMAWALLDESAADKICFGDTTNIEDKILNDQMTLMPSGTVVSTIGISIENPHNHKGPKSSRLILVKRLNDPETWDIVDIQLREVCTVVGIDTYEVDDVYVCTRAWALKQAAEWCPDDEPTTAISVIEWVEDCTGDQGSCSLTIVFDANGMCVEVPP